MTPAEDELLLVCMPDFVDQTEPFGCEKCADERPSWMFEHDGRQWWTDRFVILQADLLHPRRPSVANLPERSLPDAAKLIAAVLNGTLGEPAAGFTVELAGPLTLAGLSAASVTPDSGPESMHALVRDGEVVGAIMPRKVKPGHEDDRVSLPVSAEILAAYRKLTRPALPDGLRWAVARVMAS